MEKKYIGYVDKTLLPIKAGDRVRVPKGTIVKSPVRLQ